MRPYQPYRRRSSASFWLGLMLLVILCAGGVAGTLHLLGVNLNPFAVANVEDPFMVRIPINSQPIPAYERVDRMHLLNPATGGIMYQRVPPQSTLGMSITGASLDGQLVNGTVEAVENNDGEVVFVASGNQKVRQSQVSELGGAIMNISAILGRVVKRDKRTGLGFREETFFPQGTPEGIGGATPPGMRAITLDASRLTGVHALRHGDRIDLMANVPTGEVGSFNSQYNSRLPGAALVAAAAKNDSSTATEPMLLAQNAIVLKPVYVRNEAQTSASLTQGKRVQNVPKYEVAIAVAPEDVIPLQSALNRSLAITCVAQSMQPAAIETPAATDTSATADLLAPVTVRTILAYDVVTRDAFVNPATRRIRLEPVSRQQAYERGIVTSVDEALGAVTRHDVPAGSFIRHSDLLKASPDQSESEERSPEHDRSAMNHPFDSAIPVAATVQQSQTAPTVVGDRPAISGFIPPGHTAFAIPWNRLYGAEHLQIDDRIDLLASYSLESDDEREETETRPDGTKIVRKRTDVATRGTLRTWDESFGFRGEPWFVASEAIVIGPVGFPAPAAALRALGQNPERSSGSGSSSTVAFSGPPLMVAVDDRDVERMAAALVTKRVLFTVTIRGSGKRSTTPQGMKQIAVAAQDVDVYEMFAETVWQGNRRRPMVRLVPDDDQRFAHAISAEEITTYYDRVLRRVKRRDDFFVADDFLPAGIGPGLAAGVAQGSTVFAASDTEIEGLDAFETDDRVAILLRAVVKPMSGVVLHGFNPERAVSSVIVPQARIVRPSRRGQTILEINNADLTRLQSAWAASMSRDGQQTDQQRRSHLLAVGLPRGTVSEDNLAARTEDAGTAAADIPSFDPLRQMKVVQSIVGGRVQYDVFPGLNSQDADPSGSRAAEALAQPTAGPYGAVRH